MKRLSIAVVLGAALGLMTLAEPAAVKLPPAAEEVQALREAWGQVVKFFEEFLVEIKGAVDTLNKNDQDLYARFRAVAVQLKDLEAKLLQAQEMFMQKSTALERSVSELMAQLGAVRKSLEDVVKGYQAADAALEAKITAGLAEIKQALAAALAECRTADAALDAKIATLIAQLGELDKRLKVLESYDIGNLSRRVLSLEQAIQAVQIKIENNREKIAALEKTLGGFAADISALKESVSVLEARVGDLEGRLGTVEETVGVNVQDLSARLDTVQVLAILGLLAGIGAIVLVLLGMGG
ncbi:MAG: hypothetical protein ACK42E_05150 [Candidatus Bipolaricaulaceae bacterium]